jgi:hypothetical protein
MSGGNPKDFVGASKAPLSPVSRRVMHELGLAMLEGECKYWRHNYRAADVRAMVYMDALERHVSAWIEGQDIDPKSGVSHLIKAMACLHIIRDAQIYGSLIDDRPPAQTNLNWMEELDAKALSIVESHKHLERGAYTEANRSDWPSMSAALNGGPIKREAERSGLYIPKVGERVRVVEIHPDDHNPQHEVGVSYETMIGVEEAVRVGWLYFGGTWCRVEPV